MGRFLSPGALTLLSLLAGLGAAACGIEGAYAWGLLLFGLNRLLDGLDGTVARVRGLQSDLGGYLDMLADFLVYAAVPVALAWGRPGGEGTLGWALLLLAAFYVNLGSWLYLAAILEKRGRPAAGAGDAGAGRTTVVMPEGLVGATETTIFYAAFFLFPERLAPLFGAMALLVAGSAGQRLVWAWRVLGPGSGRTAERTPSSEPRPGPDVFIGRTTRETASKDRRGGAGEDGSAEAGTRT